MNRSTNTPERVAADNLMGDYLAGRIDRRKLLGRAAALGISMPALTASYWALRPDSAAAQEDMATPTIQLGNYEGKTLRMSVALAEAEAEVFENIVIEAFEERTGAEVQLLKIEAADVIRTLQAQVEAGEIEIDLLTQDNNSLAPLVSQQLVEPLETAEQVMPPETIEDLQPVLQFDNTYYFLPARPNVQITYYNSRVFEENNLQPPQTWDELITVAQQLEEATGIGRVSIQGVPGGAVGVTVTQFLWQAGAEPLQLDSQAAVTAFQFMQNLEQYLTPQYPTATFDTTNTYLLNESVALAQNWPFGVNVIVQEGGKEEIQTYAGWAGPAGNFLVLGGDVFGLVRGTPNKELALDFARFFMTKEIQETLTARLGWPAMRTDAFGAVAEWQQPYFESVLNALQHTKARPNVTYWLEVEQILTNAFNDIVTGGQDPQATLQRYQEQLAQLTGES